MADWPPDWPLDGIDLGDALLVLVVVVAAVLILIPLFLFGIELIVLGWALAAGLIGRVALGRPWVVEACRSDQPGSALRWSAPGWRNSRRLIDEIAASLASGSALPEGVQTAA